MSESRQAAIVFDGVNKAFGPKQVLRNVSFAVPAGKALCILGRSGTGKSVTLKLLMSLIKPDSGRILVDQDDVTRLGEKALSKVRRKMGFLFQDAALFDSLTLYENLALPLHRLTKKSPAEIDESVERVLGSVGLAGDKRKMPASLSGGMRKRRTGAGAGAGTENPAGGRAEQRPGPDHRLGNRQPIYCSRSRSTEPQSW